MHEPADIARMLHYGLIADSAYRKNAEEAAAAAGFAPQDIREAVWEGSWDVLAPAHYIAVDHARREVVVAIRGTAAVTDAIIDLCASPRRVQLGGLTAHAHNGIMSSAAHVLQGIAQPACALLEENPGYALTFVGHSLGGGTAALCAMLVHECAPDAAAAVADAALDDHELVVQQAALRLQDACHGQVTAFTMCAPSCVSPAMAELCEDYVASLVHGHDIVPRLRLLGLERLRRDFARADIAAEVRAILSEDPELAPALKHGTKLYNALQTVLQRAGQAASDVKDGRSPWQSVSELQSEWEAHSSQLQTHGVALAKEIWTIAEGMKARVDAMNEADEKRQPEQPAKSRPASSEFTQDMLKSLSGLSKSLFGVWDSEDSSSEDAQGSSEATGRKPAKAAAAKTAAKALVQHVPPSASGATLTAKEMYNLMRFSVPGRLHHLAYVQDSARPVQPKSRSAAAPGTSPPQQTALQGAFDVLDSVQQLRKEFREQLPAMLDQAASATPMRAHAEHELHSPAAFPDITPELHDSQHPVLLRIHREGLAPAAARHISAPPLQQLPAQEQALQATESPITQADLNADDDYFTHIAVSRHMVVDHLGEGPLLALSGLLRSSPAGRSPADADAAARA